LNKQALFAKLFRPVEILLTKQYCMWQCGQH